jgi:arylsulfatase A-like enzyme
MMQSMRTQMVIVLSVFLGACSASTPKSAIDNPTSAAPNRKSPNIVLIVADDLGYADLSCQGQVKDVRTPNIDTIAANGVRFTNAYVSCPVCSPTRAGLMTGRYQQRFGHEFNPGGNDPNIFGLPLDQTLLPQVLKSGGYVTGMVGKWHLGTRDQYMPTDRGFDSFFGFLGGAHSYTRLQVQDKNSIMRDKEPVQEKEYLTDAFTREACAFIDKNHDRPFFLYLPFNAIHQPQEAPAKYQDRFKDVGDNKRKLALAMLSAEDDGVGQVLAKLRAHGIEDNTLVIFHSDNGGPTKGNGSRNDPLSGYKGQVWEGGIRIPFLAQWKGHFPPGRVIEKPVIQLDVFPTACAAASVEPPGKLDGVNLLPLLTGKSEEAPHQTLYWRFSPQKAIRDGNDKLVIFGSDPPKLFDLSSDIGEKHDLAGEKPERARELKAKLDAWEAQLHKPLWKQKGKFEEGMEVDAKAKKGGRRKRAKAA